MPQQHAIHPRIQYFRIFLSQPCRRRRRRRTENHLHPDLIRQIQKLIKKLVSKHTLFRFNFAPRKFCNTDDLNSGLFHPLQILTPHRLWPVLRIVARTEGEVVTVNNLAHSHNLLFVFLLN